MNPSLVAAMVSRDDIQRLIHRQDAGRKVISLFLDMSVNSDNKRTYGVFLSKQRSRFAELDSDREAHHREALGEAFSRIERWIEDNFDEANKGLAIYAEIGGRWIAGYQVAVPLQNRFEIAERPLIGPLAEVVECHPLYGVVVLDRDSLRLLSVRSEAAKVLERLRADRVIGHSLDAAVELYAEPDLLELLKAYEPDLATVFIVSKAAVRPADSAPDGAYTSDVVPGLKVSAAPATGIKCERCWGIKDDVGNFPEHPNICARCASALTP